MLEIQQDPLDLFTTIGTESVSGSTPIFDEFLALLSSYHTSLTAYHKAPEASHSPHQFLLLGTDFFHGRDIKSP